MKSHKLVFLFLFFLITCVSCEHSQGLVIKQLNQSEISISARHQPKTNEQEFVFRVSEGKYEISQKENDKKRKKSSLKLTVAPETIYNSNRKSNRSLLKNWDPKNHDTVPVFSAELYATYVWEKAFQFTVGSKKFGGDTEDDKKFWNFMNNPTNTSPQTFYSSSFLDIAERPVLGAEASFPFSDYTKLNFTLREYLPSITDEYLPSDCLSEDDLKFNFDISLSKKNLNLFDIPIEAEFKFTRGFDPWSTNEKIKGYSFYMLGAETEVFVKKFKFIENWKFGFRPAIKFNEEKSNQVLFTISGEKRFTPELESIDWWEFGFSYLFRESLGLKKIESQRFNNPHEKLGHSFTTYLSLLIFEKYRLGLISTINPEEKNGMIFPEFQMPIFDENLTWKTKIHLPFDLESKNSLLNKARDEWKVETGLSYKLDISGFLEKLFLK